MQKACTVFIVGALMAGAAAWADAPVKPVKVSAADAAGPIFKRPEMARVLEGGKVTDVHLLSSQDKRFTAGMFSSAAVDMPIESYPVDEYCYFLSGSVKLTSADGTVTELKAGDAVVLPKGWKGRWTTSGYTKYYVVYESAAKS